MLKPFQSIAVARVENWNDDLQRVLHFCLSFLDIWLICTLAMVSNYYAVITKCQKS